MPELPEVEHVARGLRDEIVGTIAAAVRVYQPAIVNCPAAVRWRDELKHCAGKPVTRVDRRAKRLILTLGLDHVLLVQLGMTGRFMIHRTGQRRIRHTHFCLQLTDGRRVDYIDPRRFGRLWVLGRVCEDLETAMEQAGLGRLGPEPFGIRVQTFGAILQSRRPIKNLLLDQGRIAGLGNIYADESLFEAGIDPRSVSERIPPQPAESLRRAIPRILRRSIRCGGTTFSDFKNPYGEPGRFVSMLRVYGRAGQPCQTCRTLIQRVVLSNRSAHFCPVCQQRY